MTPPAVYEDQRSWQPRAKVCAALTALAVVLDGFDNQLLGYAIPAIISDWRIERSSFAWILALGLAAMSVGTFVSGVIADRIGRKRVLVASVALFAVATALAAFARNVAELGVLRILAAVGLGGAMPVATALLAEYTPPGLRGRIVTFGIVGVSLGGILCGLVAVTLLDGYGWRSLFLVSGALPLLSAMVLARFLREPVPREPSVEVLSRSDRRTIDQKARLLTLWLSLAFFCSLFAVYSVLSWGPTLFARMGHSPAQASQALLLFNVGGVVGGISFGLVIDRVGHVRMIVGVVLAGAAFALMPWAAAFRWNATVAWMLVLGACVMSAQIMLFAQAANSYPALFRATGIGVVLGVGRLGAITSSLTGSALIDFGLEIFFSAVAVSLLLVAVASWQAGTGPRSQG